jgi:hypothetical protein
MIAINQGDMSALFPAQFIAKPGSQFQATGTTANNYDARGVHVTLSFRFF